MRKIRNSRKENKQTTNPDNRRKKCVRILEHFQESQTIFKKLHMKGLEMWTIQVRNWNSLSLKVYRLPKNKPKYSKSVEMPSNLRHLCFIWN